MDIKIQIRLENILKLTTYSLRNIIEFKNLMRLKLERIKNLLKIRNEKIITNEDTCCFYQVNSAKSTRSKDLRQWRDYSTEKIKRIYYMQNQYQYNIQKQPISCRRSSHNQLFCTLNYKHNNSICCLPNKWWHALTSEPLQTQLSLKSFSNPSHDLYTNIAD